MKVQDINTPGKALKRPEPMQAVGSAGVTLGLFIEVRMGEGEQAFKGILGYVRERALPWSFYLAVLGEVSLEDVQNHVRLDGMIVQQGVAVPMHADRLAREHKIPVVELWGDRNEPLFPTVTPDDFAVGQAVGEHFLSCGFEQFGFLSFAPYPRFGKTRLEGYRAVVERAGKQVRVYDNPSETWINFHEFPHRRRMDQWLAALPKPVAIMAVTDVRARHLLGSCRRLKLRIPEDVAICGVDDKAICEADTPPFSSVPLGLPRLGYEAARLLDGLMRGEPPPTLPLRVAPLPLVVRQSSNVYATADADVQAALRFIHGNAGKPLCVEQVVDSALVSRSGLQKKFREQLGRTIQEEIWRTHVERAKQLLISTSDDLRWVARACGFRSPQRFSQVFRRHTGCSPRQYRLAHGR